MSSAVGVSLPRLSRSTTTTREILKYAVDGKVPGFTADFIDNYYSGHTSLSSAITHSRSGNAVMTDGYGPELVVNGGFDSDSDWTKGTGWSISDGKARSAATTYQTISQALSNTAGIYEVRVQASGNTNSDGRLVIDLGGDQYLSGYGSEANGSFVAYLEASADATLAFGASTRATARFNGSIDSVSVREMPVLKWAPHNLLSYSEDFTQSSWTKTQTSLTSGIADPSSGTSAFTLTADGPTTNNHVLSSYSSATVGVSYTSAIWVRRRTGTGYVAIYNPDGGGLTEITNDLTSEWQLFTKTQPATATNVYAGVRMNAIGDEVDIWGAHVYRSDLGGMVDNPERGDSYVPTAIRTFGSQIVENGTFATDVTGWTETSATTSVSASGVEVTTTSTDKGGIVQALSLVVGQRYALSLDYTGSNDAIVQLGNASFSGNTYQNLAVDGPLEISFVAGYATTYLSLRINNASSGQSGTFDNVSVRKNAVDPSSARYLPRIGHHVYNGSAWVNEGLLAESEARTNLLKDTFEMSSAEWTTQNATLSDVDGWTEVNEGTATQVHDILSAGTNRPTANGTSTYVLSADIQYVDRQYVVFALENSGNGFSATIDLINKSITRSGAEGTGWSFADATIQDIGNNSVRVSVSGIPAATNMVPVVYGATTSSAVRAEVYTGTNKKWRIRYSQLESGSTPSSYIPTSGSSVTRAAESFTIPSANLPWPTPQIIGSELVTSGTFDDSSALDDWTTSGSVSVVSGEAVIADVGGTDAYISQQLSGVVTGEIVILTFDQSAGTNLIVQVGFSAGSNLDNQFSGYGVGSHEIIIVAKRDNPWLSFRSFFTDTSNTIDNVSVREINPLSVSIAMEGRMTYADTDSTEATFTRWFADSSNFITTTLRTVSADTGDVLFEQRSGGVNDNVKTTDNPYSPDILVPYNIASRHGSTFVNGATEGVALTANTTPTALPDLSSTDLSLAYDYMGTISEFRVWDKDITDAGLVEATNPSLEPSLSLTFEGTGTNSFVVNNWSE